MTFVDVVVLYFFEDGSFNQSMNTLVHEITVKRLLKILVDVEPFQCKIFFEFGVES